MKMVLEPGWKNLLAAELQKDYFKELDRALTHAYKTREIFPPEPLIFNALNLCPLDKVRVVILGQDPYHGDGQAHGLSFSVPSTDQKLPPSLRNIYQEITDDTGSPSSTSGNLESWTRQGVLLLNSTLTVEAGEAASHAGWGWERFTDTIIKEISAQKTSVVFLLWGKHAQAKASLIDSTKHHLLEAAHPSPLSAYRGFFGCKHFSLTNEYLISHSLPAIQW
jgi:uracil-DNA glycosylase